MSTMNAYGDLNGNSGITGYSISDNDEYVDIEYVSGGIYRYTRQRLGDVNFEVLKALAKAGAGLNRFLNKVRNQYTRYMPKPEPTPLEPVRVSLNRDDAVPVLTELLKTFGVHISLN